MLMNTKKLELSIDNNTGFLREDDARQYFSTFGWFCFVFCLAMFVSQELIATVVYMVAPSVYDHYLFSNILSMAPLYCIALPLAYPIIKKLPEVSPLKEKTKGTTFLKGFFVAYLVMYVSNYLTLYLIQILQSTSGNTLYNPLEASIEATPLWANVLFVVILAPILEEIVFRGIICKRLLALGEGFAIILSGAFFALLHGNLYQLFYAFTLGCMFGFVYVKTGKIIYSIIYHVFINFMGTVIPTLLNDLVRIDEIFELISSEETLNALANNDVSAIAPYTVDIAILFLYSIVFYGIIIAGFIIALKNYKKVKLDTGLLPPPKKSRASLIFLNSGIAAAIAVLIIRIILPFVLR